jgi:Mg-chelatase subunit ChlD
MKSRLFKNKKTVMYLLTMISLFGLILIPQLQAGNHFLSFYEWDNSKQTGYFDLVVTLNWNPVIESNPEYDFNYIKDTLENFARTVYDMSEGQHKIRNVYIYVPTSRGIQEKIHCDIYMENSNGVASSKENYFGHNGDSMSLFVYRKDSAIHRSATLNGQTLGLLFTRYVYGLYSERQGTLVSNSNPTVPLSGDTACQTIMTDQTTYQEICTRKNHMGGESNWNTSTNALHRMYGRSGWETLTSDPITDKWTKDPLFSNRIKRTQYTNLIMPANETTVTQTGGDDELVIHPPIDEHGNQVTLIVDRSGSMSGDKIIQARESAKRFVNLLQTDDKVAIVAFDSTVSVIVGMTKIESDQTKNDIFAAIDTIHVAGSTAMGDGMRSALDILLDLNKVNPLLWRSAVLLGDGMHNAGAETPDAVALDYKANRIRLYTIGLGFGADEDQMRRIANDTGGSYYFAATDDELAKIYDHIAQESSSTEQLVKSMSTTLASGDINETNIVVDSSMPNLTTIASWNSGDNMTVELETPSGQVVATPDAKTNTKMSSYNSDSYSDMSYYSYSNYVLYRIQTPAPGTWIIRTTAEEITNTGNLDLQAQTTTDLNLSVRVSKSAITYPTPIGITAALKKSLDIADARVIATITSPNGSKTEISLRDDGQSPDFTPKDGLYCGVFAEYTQNGDYEISVTASNPNLTAAETDSSAPDNTSVTWDLIGQDFLRQEKTSVNVSGIKSDDHGSTYSEATPIAADHSPVDGKIEQNTDMDFFKFNAADDETYSIRTAQLIVPLDTLIVLYDQNGNIIQNNKDSAGSGASLIFWTAPDNGTYYVSVEGIQSTGNYQLSVGPKRSWEKIASFVDNPPSVNILTPSSGGSVTGIAVVEAEVLDDIMIHRVQFYIDNQLKQIKTETPYTFNWDTSQYPAGGHTITIEAFDSNGESAESSITANINAFPTADAGVEQMVQEGVIVTLDGSNSTDPENQISAYRWTQTSGSAVTLSDPTAQNPFFTASIPGTLTFNLTVTDYYGASDSDEVTITVMLDPPPTVTILSPSDGDSVSGTIAVNAEAVDNVGVNLVQFYIDGELKHFTTTTPYTFNWDTSKSESGLHTISVRAFDTAGKYNAAKIEITIDKSPNAHAGPDQMVIVGDTVTLDGSKSTDTDGKIVSYLWTQTSGTPVSLSDETAKAPTFSASSTGTLTFNLTVTDDSGLTGSDAVSITVLQEKPEISLNRSQLFIGASTRGDVTKPQSFMITNNGTGTLNCTLSSEQKWLSFTPDTGTGGTIVSVSAVPTGMEAGSYTGNITITSPNAANSPISVSVTLNIYRPETTQDPFGDFSSPLSGSTVYGSIPVTGWALDDIGIERIKIYREDSGSLSFIGDATFIEGARPDVEQKYSTSPMNYKAGWGYMMLTNLLPNDGNGTFKIRAVATDIEGKTVSLGTKTITLDNANAVTPFGTIDTPTAGGMISGKNFVNWGWVLTPKPNSIPSDGSTIDVIVDGVNLGNPVYNINRPDVAALFTGYANSNGAAGYFTLDTTTYDNGIHSIHWITKDSAGNTDGIGSRYFIINNTDSQNKAPRLNDQIDDSKLTAASIKNLPVDRTSPILVKKGFDKHSKPVKALPDEKGIIEVETRELEPLQLQLSSESISIAGFIKTGEKLHPLPPGSTLKEGSFYWIPGHGFIGEYRLIFVQKNKNSQLSKREILLKIKPKFSLDK